MAGEVHSNKIRRVGDFFFSDRNKVTAKVVIERQITDHFGGGGEGLSEYCFKITKFDLGPWL